MDGTGKPKASFAIAAQHVTKAGDGGFGGGCTDNLNVASNGMMEIYSVVLDDDLGRKVGLREDMLRQCPACNRGQHAEAAAENRTFVVDIRAERRA